MVDESSDDTHPANLVRVSAPARLHLGFLDINGSLGRKFGSIGLAINSHYTTIELKPSNSIEITGQLSQEALKRIPIIIQDFYQSLGKSIPENDRTFNLNVIELIPEHSGLGSGTQLALVIGKAIAEYHHIDCTVRELAYHLGRGKRSGIGITTFEQGGFIVDAGLKPDTYVPPAIYQRSFSEDWRIVMIMDTKKQGVHGPDEKAAFVNLPSFPVAKSQKICHLTLMQLLPALIEQDIDLFGSAIYQIQCLIGDHFAPAQGGRYSSSRVASLLEFSKTLGHSGIAQSSWGPTGCIFVPSEATANDLITQLTEYARTKLDDIDSLSLLIAQADNYGATIETDTSV